MSEKIRYLKLAYEELQKGFQRLEGKAGEGDSLEPKPPPDEEKRGG